jgi:coproporphyrinogen III oxidase-like Fe-S oxidoreductase
MPVSAIRRFDRRERMRYRMLMQLFGLRLDKRDFELDFGVPVDRGLAREMAFLRVARAFERDDDEALTLSPKGRYLLVVMMREFFVGVNQFRDQARAALTREERELLFGGGDGHSIESAAALPVTGLLP